MLDFNTFIKDNGWTCRQISENQFNLQKGSITLSLEKLFNESENLSGICISDVCSYKKEIPFASLESVTLMNEFIAFVNEAEINLYYSLENIRFNDIEMLKIFVKNLKEFSFICDGDFKLVHFGKYKMNYYVPMDNSIYNFISTHLEDFSDESSEFFFEGFQDYLDDIYLNKWDTMQSLLVCFYILKHMNEFYKDYYEEFSLLKKDYQESEDFFSDCESKMEIFI